MSVIPVRGLKDDILLIVSQFIGENRASDVRWLSSAEPSRAIKFNIVIISVG